MNSEDQPEPLAPRMIQSRDILQLSLAQLEVRIDSELEQNPALEYVERPAKEGIVDPSTDGSKHGSTKHGSIDAVLTIGADGQPEVYICELVRTLRVKAEHEQNKDELPKEVRRFVINARWFIESVHQRSITLQKVIQSIANQHYANLAKSEPEEMTRFSLSRIAEEIGSHVTLVSRAVDGKSVKMADGSVLQLRQLFGENFEREVQGVEIRTAIAKIVDEEDKTSPLSDDQLTFELKTLGFNVARRTITKYRQQLNIPSSRRRKEY